MTTDGDGDRLERLWTPHRMAYIDDVRPTATTARSAGSRRERDGESLVVRRGTTVYAVLNLYPYNPGHLMVVPYRHVSDLEALTGTRRRSWPR